MGPDDFGERKQRNHAPTIALVIAAVLLLVVGAMSYMDFVETKYQKKFAEKEQRLMENQGQVPDQMTQGAAGRQPSTPGGQQNAANPNVQTSGGAAAGQAADGQSSAGAQPRGQASSNSLGQGRGQSSDRLDPSVARSASDAQQSLPTPEDPEVGAFRQSLEQAREQSRRTEERYRQITGDADAPAGGSGQGSAGTTQAGNAGSGNSGSPQGSVAGNASGSGGEGEGEMPNFLREAVSNPPGGDPEVEKRLERLRQQVRRAPSLAKVTGYDKNWGIVTFDAGVGQGVKKNQRFAVRRGDDIVGWVKVDEVNENSSIAILVTKNRNSDTAAKPAVGDDLIDFELF